MRDINEFKNKILSVFSFFVKKTIDIMPPETAKAEKILK